jgi:hypothetical protein
MMMSSTTKTTMRLGPPLVAPQTTRVMPQLWCTGCAKLRWMLTLEEARHLVSAPARQSYTTDDDIYIRRIAEGHVTKMSSGRMLVCLHALFPKAF